MIFFLLILLVVCVSSSWQHASPVLFLYFLMHLCQNNNNIVFLKKIKTWFENYDKILSKNTKILVKTSQTNLSMVMTLKGFWLKKIKVKKINFLKNIFSPQKQYLSFFFLLVLTILFNNLAVHIIPNLLCIHRILSSELHFFFLLKNALSLQAPAFSKNICPDSHQTHHLGITPQE